jgi:molecular chaperone DnaK
VHPDEAVALGAALLAHSMESGQIDGVVLVDVLPMSIGVGLPGGRFKKIIERNTRLSHKKSISIGTTRDDQESIEIVVFQGDSERAQDNEYLGTMTIDGVPKGPRGAASYDIVFSLSAEAILTVTAEEANTGRLVTAKFSTKDTPEEVRKRLAEADAEEKPAPAAVATNGDGGGFVGWLKRLFGG